jgi:uncharacterized protein (TIGR02652 family)
MLHIKGAGVCSRIIYMNLAFQYPIFGPEINCPHCQQVVAALTLTDTYLCPRHGAFEADPNTKELVHLQSGRQWRLWENEWYRQHTHPDGIRFEIHDALDKLYTQGYRATRIIIAYRYQELIGSYLEKGMTWLSNESQVSRLFGLPVHFSPPAAEDPCWAVINFSLEKEPGIPVHYPYFRMSP